MSRNDADQQPDGHPETRALCPVTSYFTEEGRKRTLGPLKNIVLEFGGVEARRARFLTQAGPAW